MSTHRISRARFNDEFRPRFGMNGNFTGLGLVGDGLLAGFGSAGAVEVRDFEVAQTWRPDG